MITQAASSITGKEVDAVFFTVAAICVVMLALISFFIVYFVIKYNSKRHPTPVDIPGNKTLETVWTVVPVLIVLFIFYLGWTGFEKRFEVPEDAMTINVTARQWSWSFEYEGGLTETELRLPVGKPVKLELTSSDVIHSFYIPAFRVKKDVVPGLTDNFLWFTPDAVGVYDLFCAEYCGLSHSSMITKVHVMEEAEFIGWKEGKLRKAEKEAAASLAGDVVDHVSIGRRLSVEKGCVSCHTVDGSPLIGPTWKGLYLKKETVITGGAERLTLVDAEYIRKSMLEPGADVVKGFPPIMPSQEGVLTEDEIEALIEYIKSLSDNKR